MNSFALHILFHGVRHAQCCGWHITERDVIKAEQLCQWMNSATVFQVSDHCNLYFNQEIKTKLIFATTTSRATRLSFNLFIFPVFQGVFSLNKWRINEVNYFNNIMWSFEESTPKEEVETFKLEVESDYKYEIWLNVFSLTFKKYTLRKASLYFWFKRKVSTVILIERSQAFSGSQNDKTFNVWLLVSATTTFSLKSVIKWRWLSCFPAKMTLVHARCEHKTWSRSRLRI